MSQKQEINKLSEESQRLLVDMNHTEIFELCEKPAKLQNDRQRDRDRRLGSNGVQGVTEKSRLTWLLLRPTDALWFNHLQRLRAKCIDCNSFTEIGIIYCSCGRHLQYKRSPTTSHKANVNPCTYTQLLHAHFSARCACTSHLNIFMRVTHTHGSGVCKRVFAYVSYLYISPSPVSCLTHPCCFLTVTSRPSLTLTSTRSCRTYPS